MAFPTDTIAIFLILISGYGLNLSGSTIPKLTKYEAKAKRAAEWSGAAEKKLWDTRYTVGAGFVATTLSLISAITYAFFIGAGYGIYRLSWTVLLAIGMRVGSRYMNSFWKLQAKVPLVDDYNQAIDESNKVVGTLDVLCVGWAIVALLKFAGL